MTSITQNQRYLPHELNTKYYATKLYRSGYSISFVCRRYKISKSSLMRWNRKFDGTKQSLVDKSHKPISKHPNSHNDTEILWIKNLIRRNPHISMSELYGKLRTDYGYSRHAASLFRFLRKMGFYVDKEKHTKYVPKPYDTPTNIGIKWQLDVKYVPRLCLTDSVPDDIKFYQYTCIDEASRERFLYWYDEQSPASTVNFINRCIEYFKYKPKTIQTDNGQEFTWNQEKMKKIHPVNELCSSLNIEHYKIKPRTPRHNGKVERSHRSDNERFYNNHSFYSLNDLQKQGAIYLKRSNNIPMQVLGWLSPLEMRKKLKKL